MPEARYDTIGANYAQFRHTEPTWEAEIRDALGSAASVLNIGAGTGNYEDLGRRVIALEPSRVMLDQRAPQAAPAVQGVAEHLPFADDSFDATLGVLTMHHWPDRHRGLREAARVAPLHVYTVYDPLETTHFWLLDYFPETRRSPMEVNAPTPTVIDEVLAVREVRTLWVPRDCKEGFAAGSWAHPHQYLDPEMQQAISLLAMADPEVLARGTAELQADLDSGAWYEKYGDIADLARADFGYRLVIAERR